MSPQDKVERVLKEIHVTFSQCPTYNGEPDKIIVDRKQFLQLLDRLNNGIFDMMEQYEQTRQSRLNAERAFKKKGDEIIEQASSSADDIYAASVLYTADAIGRIRELMDQTNESMNDLFIQFRRELREQKDVLKSHESELQSQLIDLSDTKKYLSVLQDINKERERSNRDRKAKKETEDPTEPKEIQTPAQAVEVKVNEEYFEKAGKEIPREGTAEAKPENPAGKPEVIINRDAAYFKWKSEQEAKENSDKVQDISPEDPAEEPSDEDKLIENILKEEIELSDEMKIPDRTEDGIAAEDMDRADDLAEDDQAAHPNPDFPDEESIRRAVLEDERAFEEERNETRERETPGPGHLFKTLIFGKEE